MSTPRVGQFPQPGNTAVWLVSLAVLWFVLIAMNESGAGEIAVGIAMLTALSVSYAFGPRAIASIRDLKEEI